MLESWHEKLNNMNKLFIHAYINKAYTDYRLESNLMNLYIFLLTFSEQ